jgi:hypothetical protein
MLKYKQAAMQRGSQTAWAIPHMDDCIDLKVIEENKVDLQFAKTELKKFVSENSFLDEVQQLQIEELLNHI